MKLTEEAIDMVPNLCVSTLRAKDDANAEAGQPVVVREYLNPRLERSTW